ncbi:penicillin-binding protein 2 [Candidatus Saccharibacteria bacterium]|nr:penicillin-binding protein 2 [Candidatus Saccharibacteria bacterium]
MYRSKTKSENNIRFKILKSLVLVAFAIIAVRLFVLQVIEHGAWVAKAEKQHTLLETIAAKRGEIYMMDQGEPVPVVLNQATYQVVIDPTVTDKDKLKNVLEKHAKDYITADIDKIYEIEGLRYYVVAKKIPREVAIKIAEEETPAVWLKKTNQRVYTEGEMASGMLGFVNADGIGQYGVEGSLNKELSGEDGLLKTTADINRIALSIGSDNTKIPAKDGKDIVLSIDRGLQKGTEELASNAIENTNATNASVLIMDPGSGEVLTMANLPNYNPGDYSNVVDASAYLNYVTEVPYEPASICKTFTFSAALNEGVMTADTTYFNQGYEMVDGWKINNAEQRSSLYGTLDMRDALYWSLNTGSIYALKLLGGNTNSINQTGREKLYDYYRNKFRLSQNTGIELIEAEGYIQDPNEGWGRDSVYANMTFGQNLGITMIQTATAFSAVVNGGIYRTPFVVKGVMENGKLKETERTDVVEDKILSDETSAAMREMLVNNRSYKLRAGIDRDGYEIGGKSGTAQVVKNGAYDDTMSETVGSYMGYIATAGELPKYVIMVKMWGEDQYLDGGIASELFDSVSNFLIDYLKVKPGV